MGVEPWYHGLWLLMDFFQHKMLIFFNDQRAVIPHRIQFLRVIPENDAEGIRTTHTKHGMGDCLQWISYNSTHIRYKFLS